MYFNENSHDARLTATRANRQSIAWLLLGIACVMFCSPWFRWPFLGSKYSIFWQPGLIQQRVAAPLVASSQGNHIRRLARYPVSNYATTAKLAASRQLTSMAGAAIDGWGDAQLDEVLQLAKAAAMEAGVIVRKAWGTGTGRAEVEKTKSGAADLVTLTDEECEKVIAGKIKARYPDHIIIGEETSGDKYTLTDAPTWTIDPVDGTTNFVHRWPWTCILISFIVNQEVLVAVTYDPISSELYWAVKGHGAYLKSERYEGPIHVSGTESIDQAVVIMEVGYNRTAERVQRLTRSLAGLMQRNVRSIRMAGSCGLNLAALASGKVDAYFEEGSWAGNVGTKIWDFAGGKLLVEEAGGVLIDPSGGPFDLNGRNVFAASSMALARKVQEVLQEAAKPLE